MMRTLLLTLAAVVALSEASTLPPMPDTTSVAPPEIVTDVPGGVTDTQAPVTDTPVPEVTTPEVTGNETEAPVNATISPECKPSLEDIKGVFNYTNAPEFKELSENQQILIYELLAAGEACKLTAFISPATTQRIFLLMEDLPLKYVYLFVRFLTTNLAKEGIVVPV